MVGAFALTHDWSIDDGKGGIANEYNCAEECPTALLRVNALQYSNAICSLCQCQISWHARQRGVGMHPPPPCSPFSLGQLVICIAEPPVAILMRHLISTAASAEKRR